MKVLCPECNWHGQDMEMLTAPNPFQPDDEIHGCPKCKEVNQMLRACDEPECWKIVCAGTPTPTGYRSTCHDHVPKPSTTGDDIT